MATTREDIKRWVATGVENGSTHVIVLCDSFSYEDFPVYVQPGEDVREVERAHLRNPMTRTMEVIDLRPLAGTCKALPAPQAPEQPDQFPVDLGSVVDEL